MREMQICYGNVRDKHHYQWVIQHQYSGCFSRVTGQQNKIQGTTVSMERQDKLKSAEAAHSNYTNSDDVAIHSAAAVRYSNYHCCYVGLIAAY
jgi:predicted class III extradiol MEMO1 family dioxygenase